MSSTTSTKKKATSGAKKSANIAETPQLPMLEKDRKGMCKSCAEKVVYQDKEVSGQILKIGTCQCVTANKGYHKMVVSKDTPKTPAKTPAPAPIATLQNDESSESSEKSGEWSDGDKEWTDDEEDEDDAPVPVSVPVTTSHKEIAPAPVVVPVSVPVTTSHKEIAPAPVVVPVSVPVVTSHKDTAPAPVVVPVSVPVVTPAKHSVPDPIVTLQKDIEPISVSVPVVTSQEKKKLTVDKKGFCTTCNEKVIYNVNKVCSPSINDKYTKTAMCKCVKNGTGYFITRVTKKDISEWEKNNQTVAPIAQLTEEEIKEKEKRQEEIDKELNKRYQINRASVRIEELQRYNEVHTKSKNRLHDNIAEIEQKLKNEFDIDKKDDLREEIRRCKRELIRETTEIETYQLEINDLEERIREIKSTMSTPSPATPQETVKEEKEEAIPATPAPSPAETSPSSPVVTPCEDIPAIPAPSPAMPQEAADDVLLVHGVPIKTQHILCMFDEENTADQKVTETPPKDNTPPICEVAPIKKENHIIGELSKKEDMKLRKEVLITEEETKDKKQRTSKSQKKTAEEIEEDEDEENEINTDVLFRGYELNDYVTPWTILDNWDKIPIKVISNCHFITGTSLRRIMKNYIKRARACPTKENEGLYEVPVNYRLSRKYGNQGRLYAARSQSLQSLARPIRQALAHRIYNDIDMKAAHLTILKQYCEKHKYPNDAIAKVVDNIEECIMELQTENNCDRDTAKRMILKISYGGEVKSPLDWFNEFKNNIKSVHELMIKDPANKKIIDIIKSVGVAKSLEKKTSFAKPYFKGWNIGGKLCGHLMQHVESLALLQCIAYLRAAGVSVRNIVLIFDGFMIPKSVFDPTPENLEEMGEYVKSMTGYKIKFVHKPMDDMLDITGWLMTHKEPTYAEDEAEACDFVLDAMKGNIYACKGTIYVKSTELRIWTSETRLIKQEIGNVCKALNIFIGKDEEKATRFSRGRGETYIQQTILNYIPTNDELINTIFKNAQKKLFFKNGVYDFAQRKFRQETPDDMTMVRINRDYNPNVSIEAHNKLIDIINSMFDNRIVPTEGKLSPLALNFMRHVAASMAGWKNKHFMVGTGPRNGGKGTITNLLINTFKPYVSAFGANNLLMSRSRLVTEEARALMWLLPHMWSRLIIGNEVNVDEDKEKAIINGIMLKQICNGTDTITARGLYQGETTFTFGGQILIFCNNTPDIVPADATKVMSLFKLPTEFISKSEYDKLKKSGQLERGHRIADPNILNVIDADEIKDAMVQLILSLYSDEDVEDIDAVKVATNNFKESTGDINTFIRDTFDFTDEAAFMPSMDILMIITAEYPKENARSLRKLLTINNSAVAKQKRVNGRNINVYMGIKLKKPTDAPIDEDNTPSTSKCWMNEDDCC